ncbi:MAG TPA: hypothetical protein VHY57_07670 [Rhizomicrobium sp.]|nr:hypothetical protein [Rhizomicrobium sp.]
MGTFGWPTRLKFGLIAAGMGWLAGWLVSFPFEISTALRYVDGDFRRLPMVLMKGSVIWAGFTLFMAAAGALPLMLPAVLLIPPGWIVRRRGLLIPGVPFIALLALDQRMGFLHLYRLRDPAVEEFIFTAPTFFVVSFALVVVWVYTALARRRLGTLKAG